MTSKVIVREVKLLESFKLSDQFWNLTGETITWQIKYSEDIWIFTNSNSNPFHVIYTEEA